MKQFIVLRQITNVNGLKVADKETTYWYCATDILTETFNRRKYNESKHEYVEATQKKDNAFRFTDIMAANKAAQLMGFGSSVELCDSYMADKHAKVLSRLYRKPTEFKLSKKKSGLKKVCITFEDGSEAIVVMTSGQAEPRFIERTSYFKDTEHIGFIANVVKKQKR